MSEAERRAYVLADNKLAQNAGWDPDILAIELQGLLDLEFDNLELTGFSLGEIDGILADAAEKSAAEPGPEDSLFPRRKLPRYRALAICGFSDRIGCSVATPALKPTIAGC